MKAFAERLVPVRLRVGPRLRKAIEAYCKRMNLGLAEGVRRLLEEALNNEDAASAGSLVRLEGATLDHLREYSQKHQIGLDAASRRLLDQALADHEARQLDQHPQSAVLHEKIQGLREEVDRFDRFTREVARSVFGTEIVLAHWAAVAGGSRGGADEDRILKEMRRAGEQELRSFLEKECPGLLGRVASGQKKPAVH
jgi:hypothetical protein